MELRQCKGKYGCGEWKPITEFPVNKSGVQEGRIWSWCVPCRTARRFEKKHGIAPDAVKQLLRDAVQCAICLTTEPGGRGTWHVDHDHETGRLRGVLCLTCNYRRLPLFLNDPAMLRRAADYLEQS